MTSGKASRHERLQVIAELRRRRDAGERFNEGVITAACEVLGQSRTSVYRDIDQGVPDPPASKLLLPWTSELEELVVVYGTRWTKIAKALSTNGERVSPRTVARVVRDNATPQMLSAAMEGDHGLRKTQLRLKLSYTFRGELWQADCTQLPVLVRVGNRAKLEKVWMTVFIDCFSRAICGFSVTPARATNVDSVLAALSHAITITPTGFAGAIPYAILTDGGKPYISNAMARAELRLGIAHLVCWPYHPERKGRVERFFRTIKEDLILELPLATNGPRRANGDFEALHGCEALAFPDLVDRLASYVDSYNNERPHSALGGRTPRAVWDGDDTELRPIEKRQLDLACMCDSTGKVGQYGIKHHSLQFQAPELAGYIGSRLEFRYFEHDDYAIQVLVDGEWLCEAVETDQMTEDQRHAIYAMNGRRVAEVRRGQAARRARIGSRLTPATPDKPSREGTVLSKREGMRLVRDAREATLPGVASGSLLTRKSESAVWDADKEMWV